MNAKSAIAAVSQGNLVECTEEEYKKEIRNALQDQAGRWIDFGQHLQAQIALSEVKRLDQKYNFKFGE